MRQRAPADPTPQHVEEGVDDLAPGMLRRAAAGLHCWHQRFEDGPLAIRQIGGIAMAGHGAGPFPQLH